MYAVVALGYTMVYGIIQLINFAHGEVVMIGAMVAFTVITSLAAAGMPPLLVVMLGVACAAEGLAEIARRSRGTPRIANRLLRRVRDYADVKAEGRIGCAEGPVSVQVILPDQGCCACCSWRCHGCAAVGDGAAYEGDCDIGIARNSGCSSGVVKIGRGGQRYGITSSCSKIDAEVIV